MPNWTENTLTIKGKPNDLELFLEQISSESLAFDFQKIHPIPLELEDISYGSINIDGKKFSKWRESDNPEGHATGISEEEEKRLNSLYGASCSLDWQYHNWGVKWGADNISAERKSDDCVILYFNTPWSGPFPMAHYIVKLQNAGDLAPVEMYWVASDEDDGYATTYVVCDTKIRIIDEITV